MTNWQRSERVPALVALPPAGSLDEAHLAIELWEHYSRKTLDTEQRLAVELMLAESSDGRWAADTTGRAESRQNGKGDEIEVVELWGLTQRAEAILHTAHEAATAASAHARMIGLFESHRDLRNRIKKKQSWNGNYSLVLPNGGVIVWRTRTGAGGRGLDDISRIVIDEAQHAQPEELASSLPILSVNPNPQKNFMGSGGVAGKSEFWWRQRRRALSSVGGRFSWLEHSAETVTVGPDGRIVSEVGDVADPATWARANPAYPSRISHDFLADQLETLGPELFAREHLCVWDPEPVNGAGAIDSEAWAGLAQLSRIDTQRQWALSVSRDRRWAALGIAGLRDDGLIHVEWLEHRSGTGWVLERCVEAWEAKRIPLRVHKDGPEGSFIEDLEARGVKVVAVSTADVAKATGAFLDAVANRTVRHLGQPSLDRAVRAAFLRTTTSGASTWDDSSSDDLTTLKAVTVALGGVPKPDRTPRIHMLKGG